MCPTALTVFRRATHDAAQGEIKEGDMTDYEDFGEEFVLEETGSSRCMVPHIYASSPLSF